MLSKNKIKLIKSLATKKGREQTGLFLAEGSKSVTDLFQSFDCELIVAETGWIEMHQSSLGTCREVIEATHDEIEKASLLMTPQNVLALFRMHPESGRLKLPDKGLTLFLDHIQDPGNLGTIIRLADWFGIASVFCSEGCADIYNPKTVQATMGSLARVSTASVSTNDFFQSLPRTYRVYGTFMDGENIYDKHLPEDAVIVMGNEGQGITEETARYVNERIAVPAAKHHGTSPESLNVAIATAIVCSEFKRNKLKTKQHIS